MIECPFFHVGFQFISCINWWYRYVTLSAHVVLFCPVILHQSTLFLSFLALITVCNYFFYLLIICVPYWSGNSMKIRATLILFHTLYSVLRTVLDLWQVFRNHSLKKLFSEFSVNKLIFPEGLGNKLFFYPDMGCQFVKQK